MDRKLKLTFLNTNGHEAHKICSSLLNIKEKYNKTMMRYYLIPVYMVIIKKNNPQTINAGENLERGEPSQTVGGNANWVQSL